MFSHIIGTYFDKLRLQIKALPSLRYVNYTSASHTPIPFAQHLPQSLGLYMPELFIDATVLEKFMNRTSTKLFEGDLTETKNLIYLNLYNNLTNIYKSKGTEKAVRNIFRCFHIDDKLVRLNVYSNNEIFELKDNLKQTLITKKVLNFNTASNINAVVYQAKDILDTYASAIDAIDTTGVKAAEADSAFSFTIPASAGGEGGATTIRLDFSSTTDPPVAGGGSSIGIGFNDKTDAEIAGLIIDAINASAADNIKFAVSNNGQAGYDSGLTATQGSSDTQVTLTVDNAGRSGILSTALVDTLGTSLVDVADFTLRTWPGETSGYISGSNDMGETTPEQTP